MNRLRLRLLWLLLGRRSASVGACANRSWMKRMFGPLEVTITTRRTDAPDGYSREELLEMLQRVREHEASQGWRVPDERSDTMRKLLERAAVDLERATDIMVEEHVIDEEDDGEDERAFVAEIRAALQ